MSQEMDETLILHVNYHIGNTKKPNSFLELESLSIKIQRNFLKGLLHTVKSGAVDFLG